MGLFSTQAQLLSKNTHTDSTRAHERPPYRNACGTYGAPLLPRNTRFLRGNKPLLRGKHILLCECFHFRIIGIPLWITLHLSKVYKIPSGGWPLQTTSLQRLHLPYMTRQAKAANRELDNFMKAARKMKFLLKWGIATFVRKVTRTKIIFVASVGKSSQTKIVSIFEFVVYTVYQVCDNLCAFVIFWAILNFMVLHKWLWMSNLNGIPVGKSTSNLTSNLTSIEGRKRKSNRRCTNDVELTSTKLRRLNVDWRSRTQNKSMLYSRRRIDVYKATSIWRQSGVARAHKWLLN